ncbi:hypothetical protein QBC34DRAFT_418685 [Podospora aff. communis PSN243]|uniref:Uncharacterized protein n=1 Tax=Podospora aff. communis PSN243 TaxID=3040156 RepID=A0AAV9G4T8_9PEZI|nr:hypothetical protein QBC34DRAFT_418685 [Podospora aff. communis PSN243]
MEQLPQGWLARRLESMREKNCGLELATHRTVIATLSRTKALRSCKLQHSLHYSTGAPAGGHGGIRLPCHPLFSRNYSSLPPPGGQPSEAGLGGHVGQVLHNGTPTIPRYIQAAAETKTIVFHLSTEEPLPEFASLRVSYSLLRHAMGGGRVAFFFFFCTQCRCLCHPHTPVVARNTGTTQATSASAVIGQPGLGTRGLAGRVECPCFRGAGQRQQQHSLVHRAASRRSVFCCNATQPTQPTGEKSYFRERLEREDCLGEAGEDFRHKLRSICWMMRIAGPFCDESGMFLDKLHALRPGTQSGNVTGETADAWQPVRGARSEEKKKFSYPFPCCSMLRSMTRLSRICSGVLGAWCYGTGALSPWCLMQAKFRAANPGPRGRGRLTTLDR